MLVKKKKQRTSHLYIQNKTLSYSFVLILIVVFVHTYKILCRKTDPLPYHCLQMSFLHNVCRNMSMRIAQRKQQMQQLCKKLSFPWLEEKIGL